MEKLFRKGLLSLFAFVALLTLQPQKTQARPGVGISFQVFYDNLEPYGRWVNDRQYGYIWIPDAERDFQPYASRGHWIQTGYGNTWVSDYAWGWAPFHYGRWVLDDYYGWAWIPGDEWGPGWVDWRSGGGYYGWAPMGPSIHISINIPLARWIFVPQRYICQPDIYRYRVYGNRGGNIYRNTTIINNYYTVNNRRYAGGPGFDEIRRVTNRPVRVYNVHDGDRPGNSNVSNRGDVNFYRPSINRRADDRGPSRVADSRPAGRGDDNRNAGVRNNGNSGRPDNRTATNNDSRSAGINWQQGRSTPADNDQQDKSHINDRTYGNADNRPSSQPARRDNATDHSVAKEQQQRELQVLEQQSREQQSREQQSREQQSREALNQRRERAERQSGSRPAGSGDQRIRQQRAQPQQQPRQQTERTRQAESRPRQQESRGNQGNSGRPQRVG